MTTPGVIARRLRRRIRDALPGATTASRLKPDPNSWRSAPAAQRAAAYAQYCQTLQQLRQIHVQQKIAPKIVNLLFALAASEFGWGLGIVLLLLIAAGL